MIIVFCCNKCPLLAVLKMSITTQKRTDNVMPFKALA